MNKNEGRDNSGLKAILAILLLVGLGCTAAIGKLQGWW